MLIVYTAAALAALCLVISLICYFMAFHAPRREKADPDSIDLPGGEVYVPFYELMTEWTLKLRALPCEEFYIDSHDGLKLCARFYEYAPGAPMEIMFHGYRGGAERDMAGGVQRAFSLGRSVLLVDQRCSGKSGGHVISFGINEHKDCLRWAEFAAEHFGKDTKIILTGISMGASTVLMTANKPLPENVIGILADCGFTTAKDIIKKVIRQIKLPADLLYPFVKFAARVFGGFELEADSALRCVKESRVPIIFFHGESDDFVPCEMSRENFNACAARKMLVTVPKAGHGLCYPVAPERYLEALREFFGEEASYKGQ